MARKDRKGERKRNTFSTASPLAGLNLQHQGFESRSLHTVMCVLSQVATARPLLRIKTETGPGKWLTCGNPGFTARTYKVNFGHGS